LPLYEESWRLLYAVAIKVNFIAAAVGEPGLLKGWGKFLGQGQTLGCSGRPVWG